MQGMIRLAAGCGVVALLAALLPLAAVAHEEREVAGGYEVVVGFIDEPAFVGEKNGLILEVSNPAVAAATPVGEVGEDDHGGAAPVLGLAETLQVEVIYGEETLALEMIPSFSDPGSYFAYFFPMAEGDYTFRIFGQVEGNAVEERFTSSPEGFSSVEPREPLEFPKGEASSVEVGALGVVTSGGSGGGLPGGGGPIAALGVLVGGAGLWLAQRRSVVTRRSPAVAAAVRS